MGGYPGEDTPEYPPSLGYPLPWEVRRPFVGQDLPPSVDLGSLRATKVSEAAAVRRHRFRAPPTPFRS